MKSLKEYINENLHHYLSIIYMNIKILCNMKKYNSEISERQFISFDLGMNKKYNIEWF